MSDPEPTAEAPADHPRYAPLLAQAWAEAVDRETPLRADPTMPFRYSDAGKCGRALGYGLSGLEPSDPMDLTGYWATGIGIQLHKQWQEALKAAFGATYVEVPSTLAGVVSGHADALVGGTAIELKTINGTGFRIAIGDRGQPQGPRLAHRIQGALNAVALGASELAIVYVSLESISPQAAEKRGLDLSWQRFCAEWRYPAEEFTPWAFAELERMRAILKDHKDGLPVPRRNPEMPSGAYVDDPSTGRWVLPSLDGTHIEDSGKTWTCGYCNYRSHCEVDG